MKQGLFVTGTDTGIGKTVVSALLAAALREAGATAGYFKVVQTGTESDTATVGSLAPGVALARPAYTFALPAAPSRAAAAEGRRIDLAHVRAAWDRLPAGRWVVEGAGGLMVPLEERSTIRDLIVALRLPLLVVASTRLGTINHTLLTLEAARVAGIEVRGVVFSGACDPGLAELLGAQAPILAEVPPLAPLNGTTVTAAARVLFPPQLLDALFATSAPKANLAARDARTVWHPYTQHGLRLLPVPVISAQGARLRLADGREVVDAISSWWVNLHGHAHPEIARAIGEQAARLEHVLFAGFTHAPAVELAEELIGAAQSRGMPLRRVFYSDDGSTAVEVALKLAYRFHALRGEARPRFLALRGAYHGDTFGAMAAGDPDGFHAPFRKLFFSVDFVEPEDVPGLERLLARNDYAAMIVEPMIQGAGGMRLYDAAFLRTARDMTRRTGALFIADEVFTGFCRTGPLFACEHAGVAPDLLCLSKGLTGGFLPLAVTLATEEVFEAFLSEDRTRAFLHGHSYTGNPLACAAALASWRILQRPATQERIAAIAARTAGWVEKLASHPHAENARALGTIGAVNAKGGADYFSRWASRTAARALELGVLLRPLGGVLYAVPPYCVSEEEIDRIYNVMGVLLDDVVD